MKTIILLAIPEAARFIKSLDRHSALSQNTVGSNIHKLEVFIEHMPRAECLQLGYSAASYNRRLDVTSRASLYRVYCVRV